MNMAMFSDLVLSKIYFDSQGLILALDDDVPVGFVHAGFGPNEDGTSLSTERGVVSMIIVRKSFRRRGIGGELLQRAETYLRERNSISSYGGGFDKYCPYYVGLYGGSQLPGILESERDALGFFQASGYQVVKTKRQIHLETACVTPPVSRELRLLKRRYIVKSKHLTGAKNWWDACTMGEFDRVLFELEATSGGPAMARCQLWRMEPYTAPWGDQAAGLTNVFVRRPERRQRLATFLLGEAMRQIRTEGISLVLAQIDASDKATGALADRLGFQTWATSAILEKQLVETPASEAESAPQ